MALGSSRRLLSTRLGRRTLLRGAASAGALALLGQVPAGVAVASPWTSTVVEAAAGRSKRLDVSSRSIASTAVMSQADDAAETVYVFNVGSRDVTLIDAATRQVRETRPLGAAVRWLSNEQTYWDGQHVWTYEFPDNKLQVIAIDPQAVAVTRTIADIGTGPAHSVMLLPDRTKAVVNVAGDNRLAFLDLAAGQVEAVMETGAYP
jgi:YVTN family beta-propeller protein